MDLGGILPGRPGGNRLGVRYRPAASENRQPAQQRALFKAEQVVTPIDGRAQGALAFGYPPPADQQQAKYITQPGGDFRHFQAGDPRAPFLLPGQ